MSHTTHSIRCRTFSNCPRSKKLLICFFTFACTLFCFANFSLAINPDAPDVKNVIAKGVKYLETATHDKLGGKCLIGLVFLKNGENEKHPQVNVAVEACLEAAKVTPEANSLDVYSNGLSIIFLCTLDPYKYRPQIESLLRALEYKQKACGAWGYPNEEKGDSSMTQYGALSLWEASKVGFFISPEEVERVATWLLRVQDSAGGWPYKGELTGTSLSSGAIKRINQGKEVFIGVTVASMGSSYICADLLGISFVPLRNDDPDLPAVLVPILDQKRNLAARTKIESKLLEKSLNDGRLWFSENYEITPKRYPFYYLYALERYQSFKEAADGRVALDPKWYNEGFAHLKKTQSEDGSWAGSDTLGPAINTSFGCLFLMRSTRKSIQRAQAFAAASMSVGVQLPDDLQNAKLRDQRIVLSLGRYTSRQAMQILSQPQHPDFAKLTDNCIELGQQLKNEQVRERWTGLDEVASHYEDAPNVGKVTILRMLGHSDQLRMTPVLLRGLEDADLQVRREAFDALQYLTKRISPLGAESLTKPEAYGQLREDWKRWYARIGEAAPSGN